MCEGPVSQSEYLQSSKCCGPAKSLTSVKMINKNAFSLSHAARTYKFMEGEILLIFSMEMSNILQYSVAC